MPFENPISLAGFPSYLVRVVTRITRITPYPWRKWSVFGRLGLLANATLLRQYFSDASPEHDRHTHWVAIGDAASVLSRLGIRHPRRTARPDTWMAFLAHIVVAAGEGDINRARSVISTEDWDSSQNCSSFGASSPPLAYLEKNTQRKSVDVCLDDKEAVKSNPGSGYRVVRLIMNASTVSEVQNLYEDFQSTQRRTRESEVFAAYVLQKDRLLGDQRETQTDWWWELHGEAEKRGFTDEIYSMIEQLEEEYPDD